MSEKLDFASSVFTLISAMSSIFSVMLKNSGEAGIVITRRYEMNPPIILLVGQPKLGCPFFVFRKPLNKTVKEK